MASACDEDGIASKPELEVIEDWNIWNKFSNFLRGELGLSTAAIADKTLPCSTMTIGLSKLAFPTRCAGAWRQSKSKTIEEVIWGALR